MNLRDRPRQRGPKTPGGNAPNWLLVVVAGAVTVVAMLASSLA